MPEKTTGQKALPFWPVTVLALAHVEAWSPSRPTRPAYASCLTLSAACAAARRATGTRNGEQLT